MRAIFMCLSACALGRTTTTAGASSTTDFARVVTPNPPVAVGSLLAESCVGDWCMGVGDGMDQSGGETAIAATINGNKGVAKGVPLPVGTTDATLAGVSCVSNKWCMAVGQSVGSGASFQSGYEPLAEVWNGTAWTVVPVPADANATGSRLLAVSCASAASCQAVGTSAYSSNPGQRGFVEMWNGATWSM